MKRRAIVGVGVSLLLAGIGCSGDGAGGDDASENAAGRDSTALAEAAGDSVPTDHGDSATSAAPRASTEDPFRGFDLPSENGTGEMRRYRLRLRNDGDSLAIVFADGGAGEVLLDTVPAGSWRPVEVDSRARLVRLRSVTPGGSPLRSTELGAPADTAIDLAVGPPTPAR